jgi:hypothetical protein
MVMLWLMAASAVLAGFHFDQQLASLLVFSTAEIQMLALGALFGLGLGRLIRQLEAI